MNELNERIYPKPVEDWAVVKQRWMAWWEHGLYDRPLLQVTAPRDGVTCEWEQVTPETQWTSVDYMIRRAEEDVRCTFYGGEALPRCWNPISAGWSILFGCQPHYTADTVFVDPAAPGADGFPSLEGWRETPAWPWIWEGHLKMACASRGRFFVPPFWGNSNMDILGTVRGIQPLMMDFVENRQWLSNALRRMNDILYTIYSELWPHLGEAVTGLEGNIETSGFWAPGTSRCFDADLAYNISTRDFRELILPPLVEWMQRIEYSSWHLDGAGNFRHLDTLLAVPELKAIQWVQGDGPYHAILQWVPLLQKVQARGKSLQVLCEAHEVLPVLKELRPEGLVIQTGCRSEGEARALIETVDRMYR